MAKAHFNLSFALETNEKTMIQIATRLDPSLVGQIKDVVAKSLDRLEFDLQERYRFLAPDPQT